MRSAPGWWPIFASSWVLSLALLGDALLYAVLPIHAEAFGISLVWVGILLSANRFVRVFLYGLVAQLSAALGPRIMCTAAACGAVVSTGIYGLGEGEFVLLLGRILWGLSYAVLVLVTLAVAVQSREGVGARVGWSRALQRIGPIAALLGGAWLTNAFGPRTVFIILAVVTIAAVPLALSLPRGRVEEPLKKRPPALGRPRPIDALFFLQGMGVDGVFALTVTLILAQELSVAGAVLSGAALLAMRHFSEAVAAPIFGHLGDRIGPSRVFAASVALTACGFAMVAMGLTVTGALVMLIFRGALASLGPATVVEATHRDAGVMVPLARMQAWRDFGAAIGPLATGFALAAVSPEAMHAVVGLFLLVGLFWWHVRS